MTDGSILRTTRPGNPRMDLRDAGAPKRLADPVLTVAEMGPLACRAVERCVPPEHRGEVFDMLGLPVAS